jgi:hypothetical protein
VRGSSLNRVDDHDHPFAREQRVVEVVAGKQFSRHGLSVAAARRTCKPRRGLLVLVCHDRAVAEPTIPVPTGLRRPHPFVAATRDAAAGLKPAEDGRLNVGGREGIVWMRVTRARLHRALLVAEAILREAERRGYTIEPIKGRGYGHHSGVAVSVRGHAYSIEISELFDRVPLTAEETAEWERREAKKHYGWWQKPPQQPHATKVPTGYLRVSLPAYGGRSSFSEGPRGRIERRLPTLFEELERRAEEDDRRAAALRQAEEERRAAAARRAERERLERLEKARVERLEAELSRLRLVRQARQYSGELRRRLPQLEPPDRDRIGDWCDWIDSWCEAHDPSTNPAVVQGLVADAEQEHRPDWSY